MTATVTVMFRDGKFRIKVVDESTGKSPTSLVDFYNEPYRADDALRELGLDADKRAYLMMPSIAGQQSITGLQLPDA